MPTYEYECLSNGHRFEVKQSFSDPALTACEVCGEPVRKVFSPAGIVFKGSGYYVTDTRKAAANGSSGKADKKEGAAADAAGSSGDSGGSTTSGDGKAGGDKTAAKASGGTSGSGATSSGGDG